MAPLSDYAAQHFGAEIASFRRSLRARNLSDNTVRVYTDAAERFANWLGDWPGEEAPTVDVWDGVEAAHIQAWMISLLDTNKPGYANNQFRSIQQFWKWWSAEEELPSPMLGLTPPTVPEQPVQVLRKEHLGALLRSCQGREFINRRDLAILYIFMDSGIRRAELAGLQVADVDLDQREVHVLGKGRRGRIVTIGRRAAVAVDRYLRERGRQKWGDRPELWLAEKNKGVLTKWGVREMLERRGRAVGIPNLHPHMLRHSWAHYAKQNLSEEELMRLAGWRSRQMVDRYAASLADERAREAGKRRPLGDEL
ncbi:tyrosine recombinase XerC [Sphaerisporangium siamense]|uniref:Site-specific recombinase XerD n=1 Tax=Sphaerisporangium siamense TaxID=795645 RepID=A0A7W7D8G0_9ACTN|nr:tyrosine-type recombinase/integrase [Sphaerisporangium siamense]MBB4702182.1 site-specific recombinase XerD [Sphaerisporangium siamense]GII87124.1 tyrosine recombinase XerC [Sphaerisporangium siamense]